MVVGGIFLVIFVGLLVAYKVITAGSPSSSPAGETVNGIPCQTGEQLAVHYHAHLNILYKGQPVTIPALTGIPANGSCFYWMHTHTDSGIIHIEAPAADQNRNFTIGDFFAIWGQPISSTQVSTIKLGSGDQVKVWVDRKPYTGDPSKVVLKSHTSVVIQIGPPFQDPPPVFDWNDPTVVQESGSS
jgi:hypothetical protein